MDTLVKLNNQSAGRDKIARLLQYLSRVLWHRLRYSNKDQVNAFKNLEYQLSTFRKLLRFGRCFDTMYSTLPLLDHHDAVVRHILILSRIAQSLFLLGDHLLWLGRADVCSVNTQKWSRISNKYWLYSITMNLSNRSVVVDTLKNGCDFFIPLTALGHINLTPGTVGWLGVISSLAGLLVLIEPKTKLSPA